MPKIGDIIEAKVVKVLPNGAILSAGDSFDYFLPVKEAKTSEKGYIRMEDVVSEGETIKARIKGSKKHKGKVSFQLSLALLDDKVYQKEVFDKKMKDFLKSSDEIQKQVRQNRERKQNGRKNRPLK